MAAVSTAGGPSVRLVMSLESPDWLLR